MRTPAAIYPFTCELLPLVKYFDKLQSSFTITRVISMPGLGLAGKDAGYSCNHPDTGYIVTDKPDMKDPTWKTLIVARPLNPDVITEQKLADTIANALSAGKEARYFDTGIKNVPNAIWDLALAWPEKLEIITEDMNPEEKSRIDDRYCVLNSPIILIGGLITKADTLEVLSGMAVSLNEQGLHPLVITRQPCGKLFGFHSLSHVFQSKDKSEAEKIVQINYTLRDLEHKYLPDVILMEAPDTVMRYNDIAPNGFGIQTYMLCQAAAPDYFICCTPCDLAVGVFLKMLSEDFSYRLGASINAAHVTNIIVDAAEIQQTHEVSYVHTNLDLVRENIEKERLQSEIPLFDVITQGAKKLTTHLFGPTIQPD